VIVAAAAKNAASKNHPKDILRNKNHFYRIVLVHLTSNDMFKTRKHLQMAGYEFLKIVKTQNFVSLPHHIRKPRRQTKHCSRNLMPQQQTHQ